MNNSKFVTAIHKKSGHVMFFASRTQAAQFCLGSKPYYAQKVSKIISDKCSEKSYKGWTFYDGKLNVEELYKAWQQAKNIHPGGKREKIPVIGRNLATGLEVEFNSMNEAAAFLGVNEGAIAAVLAAPDRRQTAGFIFEKL